MSEIKVDNLTGKTTANDITVTVGATATQSLEQGLAKHWIRFIGTGTVAIRDSLSASSLTDTGTGYYTVAITNNLTDANYCLLIAEGDWRTVAPINEASITASDYDLHGRSPSTAAALDSSVNSVAIHGGLA